MEIALPPEIARIGTVVGPTRSSWRGTEVDLEGVPYPVRWEDRHTVARRARWFAMRKAGLSPVIERYKRTLPDPPLWRSGHHHKEVITIYAGGWGRKSAAGGLNYPTSERALRNQLAQAHREGRPYVRVFPADAG
jgi:hypothetical protein